MTRILSLDDCPAILELLSLILERKGYEHLWTGDSYEALTILRNEPIDLFTQDNLRADVDGPTLYRMIKAEPALCDIPMLVMSAKSAATDLAAEPWRMPRLDGYMQKPFSPQEVWTEIEGILKRHSRLLPTEEDKTRNMERRRAILRQVVAAFPNLQMDEQDITVEGQRGCYRIKLPTGEIFLLPSGRLSLSPQRGKGARDVCLPFEDTDTTTEKIIAITLLLSDDTNLDAVLEKLRTSSPGLPSGKRPKSLHELPTLSGSFEPLPQEPINIADLIRLRVQERFSTWVCAPDGSTLAAEVQKAWQAFAEQRYLILASGRRFTRFDEQLALSPDIKFIRLMPLLDE